MELRKALLKQKNKPSLAWHLFKHLLTSQTPSSLSNSIPTITHILISSKMFQQLDHLHNLILLQPPDISYIYLTTLTQASAKSGLLNKALSQFDSLRSHFPTRPPSIHLYNVLLESSFKENRLDCVSRLYKDMLLARVLPETYTFNLMISFFTESGRLEDATNLFDKMPVKGCRPNVFSFGILIKGYCNAGLGSEALEVFNKMGSFGCEPNMVIFNTLISCFCKEGNVGVAEMLVEKMRENGLSPNVVTFNCRISALCSVGKVLEGYRIFSDMQMKDDDLGLPRPNLITFNIMLEGFCKERMLEEAEVLVESMKEDGMFTTLESYNTWLLGLVRNENLLKARSVLQEMIEKGISPNIYSYNILINGLCKKGMNYDARLMMELMRNNGTLPDTVTYSTLLHGYCKKGKVTEANNILHEMTRNGCFPNTYTCNILLRSLWKERRVLEAEKLLQKMNERGYSLDTVTCNIVIGGLCKSGKLDKAIEILNGMWTHGSAALGDLGNSFIGLVDSTNNRKKCIPDLVTYTTIIDGLCRAERLDEAKKKFSEMIGKNVGPDSVIYDTFIHSFCKQGKTSSAFRVLRDMEKKGCNPSTRGYNSLIWGLGSKGKIDEIFQLMNEMAEKGVPPDVFTYNNLIRSLCEGGSTKEATSFLDKMLQSQVTPNVTTFHLLIKAFCKDCVFGAAQEVFEIALSMFGHKEALYVIMLNELLAGGKTLEANQVFIAAMDRGFDVRGFSYKDLIEGLCNEEKLKEARSTLHEMIDKEYQFDPASFMPLIDALGKNGNKHEADELAEMMMGMASDGRAMKRTHHKEPNKNTLNRGKPQIDGNDWQTILNRDDGSGIAVKALKRVQKGWGQGIISSLQSQKREIPDYWEDS